MFRHHLARFANSTPVDSSTVMHQIGTTVGIVAGILGIIAAVVYLWADHKDQKEIAELLKKSGININH